MMTNGLRFTLCCIYKLWSYLKGVDMISDYLVNKMIASNIIEENDREIYSYGLKEGIVILQNLIISLGLGILFNNFVQTLAFLGAYIPLRSFAGGYHARTEKRCFVYSFGLIFLLELYFTFGISKSHGYLLPLAVIAIVIICKLAPLQNENKPLSLKEKHNYAWIVKKVLLIEVVLVLIFGVLNLSELNEGILIALIVEGVLLIVGKCI